MNKIIVLVGESASGKTEIEKGLERIYGIQPLVSHTSRPKRVGEIDGVHYHFVDDKAIRELIEGGDTVEHTTYEVDGETWYYALARSEMDKGLQHKLSVVTINPRGIEQMLEDDQYRDNLIITYLKADEGVRAGRYFKREDDSNGTLNRWKQRLEQDLIDFDYFERNMIKRIKKLGVDYLEIDNNENLPHISLIVSIARDEIKRLLKEDEVPFYN